MVPPLFRLCMLLTRELCAGSPAQILKDAIAGGVDCVQLREKDALPKEFAAWAAEVKNLTDDLGVPLIVNDSVEVALAVGAAGVHVGQDDLHPWDVRKLVGDQVWVGWSTHSLEQLDEAAEVGADYAGFGPVFASPTKGYTRGLGAEHLAAGLAIARVPLVAIGGIHSENVWMIPEQAGVAVSSALCEAIDPAATATALLQRGKA